MQFLQSLWAGLHIDIKTLLSQCTACALQNKPQRALPSDLVIPGFGEVPTLPFTFNFWLWQTLTILNAFTRNHQWGPPSILNSKFSVLLNSKGRRSQSVYGQLSIHSAQKRNGKQSSARWSKKAKQSEQKAGKEIKWGHPTCNPSRCRLVTQWTWDPLRIWQHCQRTTELHCQHHQSCHR